MRRGFRVLVDTSVWLDLAKDYRKLSLLDALEDLVGAGVAELILPRIIVDEFERNRARVLEDANRGVASVLRRARSLVERLADENNKAAALAQLDEVDFRVPRLRESAIESLSRVEVLFARCEITETSEEILLAAANRAIRGIAPFHRTKNSIGDAVILETYLQALRAASGVGLRFAFITHNTKDFSHPTDDSRLPHPDIATCFTKVKSLYFTSLAAALRRIEPDAVADATFERDWYEEARGLSEVVEVLGELVDKLWYGRHQGRADAVENGRIRLVNPGEEIDPTEFPRTIQRDIWDGARKAARKVETQYGLDALGPWDDFEWGMLSGKVSALRWVLGDDWDMLDT